MTTGQVLIVAGLSFLVGYGWGFWAGAKRGVKAAINEMEYVMQKAKRQAVKDLYPTKPDDEPLQ